jgi:SulP family sulfate permease
LALRWLKRRLGWVLLPELLLAVIASAALTSALSLDAQGVKVIGAIPARLPSFAPPEWDLERVQAMASGATAVALLGLLEAISMAKAIASHTRQHVDMNQQCLSEGVANLVGSFFHCFPGSGSLTRSAINQQAGAVSQWSGVFSAIAVALTMLLFAPLARYIPRAALAGILLVAAFKMVDFKSLAYYVRASRFDRVIVSATALSAVLISIEFCVLIGVLLSFVMAVPRIGHMLLTEFVVSESGYVHERLDSDRPCPQIRIFGLEGEMFFAATASLDRALDRIEASITPETRVVILRMKRARNPDAVGLSALDQFLVDVAARGVQVLICGVRNELLRSFERAGIVARVGKEHVFEEQPVRQTSTHQAVKFAYGLIETRCAQCPLRGRDFETTNYAI